MTSGRLFVLAVVVAVAAAGCTGDPDLDGGSGDRTRDRVAAGSPSPEESTDAPTSAPAPNPVESATVEALRRLGVPAEPAEYSYEGAVLWAAWPSGGELHLTARPPLPTSGDYTVTGSRLVDGVRVENVVYEGTPSRRRFVCESRVTGLGEIVYEVGGNPGPSYASMDDFLAALVAEVCRD